MDPDPNSEDLVRTPTVLLIIGAVVMLIMCVLSVMAIIYVPASKRIEGLVLILLAVVADCFLSAFIRIFGLFAKKCLNRADIMADLYRKDYRIAGNIVSGLFVVPMLIAIIRILSLKEL